jgi:hypothetical protein
MNPGIVNVPVNNVNILWFELRKLYMREVVLIIFIWQRS